MRACKERLVVVFPDLTKPDSKRFNALRHDDDGDVYVVMGPIEEPRNIITERQVRFACSSFMLIGLEFISSQWRNWRCQSFLQCQNQASY